MRNILFNLPTGEWRKLFGKKVLVLFSGGKDSSALLQYMHAYSELWAVAALHFNHHLRGSESDRDAGWCRDFCAQRAIPFFMRDIFPAGSPEAINRGVEHAARVLRYEAAEACRLEAGYDYLVTAHTSDDKLESFFVDILTGASIYTMAGINAEYQSVLRPMLSVSTAMVHEYLKAEGITPVFDSSNAEKNYVRNRVRLELIPVLDAFGDNYKASVSRLQEESALLNAWLNELTAPVLSKTAEDGLIIDRLAFEALPAVGRVYVLGKVVSSVSRGSKAHIAEIEKALITNGSKRLNLPGAWICEINPLRLRFFPESKIKPFCVTKEAGADSVQVGDRLITFATEEVGRRYTLRSRRDGDRFNGKRLKKILGSMKIDLYDRDRAVIVEEDGEIVRIIYDA